MLQGMRVSSLSFYLALGNRQAKVLVDEETEHWYPLSCRLPITHPIFFFLPLNLSSGYPQNLFIQHLFIKHLYLNWGAGDIHVNQRNNNMLALMEPTLLWKETDKNQIHKMLGSNDTMTLFGDSENIIWQQQNTLNRKTSCFCWSAWLELWLASK